MPRPSASRAGGHIPSAADAPDHANNKSHTAPSPLSAVAHPSTPQTSRNPAQTPHPPTSTGSSAQLDSPHTASAAASARPHQSSCAAQTPAPAKTPANPQTTADSYKSQ